MRFEKLFEQWRVSFVNLDAKEVLREYSFTDEFKVEQLAERAGALRDLAARQGLEAGLHAGIGAITLHLTDGQYASLKQ
jgi:hypothetical protein